MKNKTISVLLPVYNGGDYLTGSVNSVLAQAFDDFEFLVLDDCSTDESWAFLQTLRDPRLRLYRNEKNRGLFYNLNFLIRQSRGRYIKLWSQDDIMYPHCLQAFAAFHAAHPQIGFCYSGRDIIDEKGRLREQHRIDQTPALVSPVLHARIAFFTGSIAGNIANVSISRAALDKVGLFNEGMRISADFDLWVRLAEFFDTGFLPARLIQLRDHRGQLSRQERYYFFHVKEDLQVYRYLDAYVSPALRKEGRQLMRKHKLVFYYTLMVKSLLKGHPRTAFRFCRELAAYDNFLVLTYHFLQARIRKPVPPVL